MSKNVYHTEELKYNVQLYNKVYHQNKITRNLIAISLLMSDNSLIIYPHLFIKDNLKSTFCSGM